MSPFFVTCLQRLLYQKPSEARAVQKKIALNDFTRLKHYRLYKTGLRMLSDLINNAFNTTHTPLLAKTSEVLGVEPGVKMVGVAQTREFSARQLRQFGELVPLRGLVI